MKPLLAVLMIILLSLGAAACGGAGGTSNHVIKRDRDNDNDNNDDDAHVLNYGHAAIGAEKREITSLVRGYYAAAVAEDGAKACSMLYPLLAETVPEDYGRSIPLRRRSCAAVMTKLFMRRHQLLVGESSTLKVYAMRVAGDRALTILSFAALPEARQIPERRVGDVWKVADLLDTIIE